jgi:hypothetical protein
MSDLEKMLSGFKNHYSNYEIMILNFAIEEPHLIDNLKASVANEYRSDEIFFKFRRELNSNLMFEFIKHRDKIDDYDLDDFERKNYYAFLTGFERIYFEKGLALQNELINRL